MIAGLKRTMHVLGGEGSPGVTAYVLAGAAMGIAGSLYSMFSAAYGYFTHTYPLNWMALPFDFLKGMEDMKKVGRTGGLALVYFEVVSTIALLIGLVVVNLVRPGDGVNADPATLDAEAVRQYASAAGPHGVAEHVLNVIPSTIAGAFASGEVLQVLLFSVLFGFALHAVGGRKLALYGLIEQFSAALFRILAFIMRLAPIGALGAMAFTIGKYGVDALVSLGKLMACFYATCLLFIFVVLGGIARWNGFSVWRFIRYIKEELFIVLGTSSSESVLPRMMTRMEELGVEKSAVGLVIPTGYSFNLDGTAIYLIMAAVFIAQATNTPLDLGHQLADMTRNSVMTAEMVEKERKVLLEEISLANIFPPSYVLNLVSKTLFPQNALALPISGTKESVQAIGREDLLKFYKVNYVPERAFITTIVGNLATSRATVALVDQMKDGLRYVGASANLKALTLMGFVAAFLGLPLLTFLPVMAKDVFQQDVGLYTQMMTTSGIGAVCGALVVAWYGRHEHMGRLLLVLLAACFGRCQ